MGHEYSWIEGHGTATKEGTGDMSFFVSISVTSYNRKELTEYCIRSILENTPRKNFELIVVDNQSTDGAIDMLKRMRVDGVIDKYILNQKDSFLGTAINGAWKKADPRAKWLITFSNDHFVMAKWFDNFVAVVKDGGFHYVLCHLLMPGYEHGRLVIETPSGGRYLQRCKTGKYIFGGGLALDRRMQNKHKIWFPQTAINSPFSVMCKRLALDLRLKGTELAKPCSLQQDSDWNNPAYKEYYEQLYGKRFSPGDPDHGMKILRQQQKQGYTPYAKEYYARTGYLNEKKNH